MSLFINWPGFGKDHLDAIVMSWTRAKEDAMACEAEASICSKLAEKYRNRANKYKKRRMSGNDRYPHVGHDGHENYYVCITPFLRSGKRGKWLWPDGVVAGYEHDGGYYHTREAAEEALREYQKKQAKEKQAMAKKDVVVFEMGTDCTCETTGNRSAEGVYLMGPTFEEKHLKPNTQYACTMVAIPEGYRLTTDKDEADACDETRVWMAQDDEEWKWHDCGGLGLADGTPFVDGDIIIVPKESQEEAKKRKQKQEAMERLAAMDKEAAKLRTTIESM